MNKVWLVTGAGSGIGECTAKAALRAGDRVVATGRRIEKVRAAFTGWPADRVVVAALDVTDQAQAALAVETATARFGRIDVVVQSAGFGILGNFEEMTQAEFEEVFSTNFLGTANVMRAVLPIMRLQRAGHILNIGSVAGSVGLTHCAAYGGSKFAMHGLSMSVAEEVAQFGVKVTIVEPGFFRTDILAPEAARWPSAPLPDYAHEGGAEAVWSGYHGTQRGDPERLADALVQIAGMADPPRHFVAGADAYDMLEASLNARLVELRALEALSRSTDGPADW